MTYHDANSNGAWDDGEDIVLDANGNLVFDWPTDDAYHGPPALLRAALRRVPPSLPPVSTGPLADLACAIARSPWGRTPACPCDMRDFARHADPKATRRYDRLRPGH